MHRPFRAGTSQFFFDKPGAGELRETTRPEHLGYLKRQLSRSRVPDGGLSGKG